MLTLNNYIVDEYIRREKESNFDCWEFYWQLSTSASSIILGAIESNVNRPSMKTFNRINDVKNLIKKEKEAQQLLNMIVTAETEYLDPYRERTGGKLCMK